MLERTLLLNGFSKTYGMTGWRVGYAAGPRPLIAAMTRIHQYTALCASRQAQEAAIEALRVPEPARTDVPPSGGRVLRVPLGRFDRSLRVRLRDPAAA